MSLKDEAPRSKCKGCGRPIIWGQSETGAHLPEDLVNPEVDPEDMS